MLAAEHAGGHDEYFTGAPSRSLLPVLLPLSVCRRLSVTHFPVEVFRDREGRHQSVRRRPLEMCAAPSRRNDKKASDCSTDTSSSFLNGMLIVDLTVLELIQVIWLFIRVFYSVCWKQKQIIGPGLIICFAWEALLVSFEGLFHCIPRVNGSSTEQLAWKLAV